MTPRVELNDFRPLVDDGLDLFAVVGLDGVFKAVSPPWERVFGYSEAEMVGRSFADFIYAGDKERTLRELKAVTTENGPRQFENRYVRKDGAIRWLDWRYLVDQHTEEILCIARDVTESRIASEEARGLAERISQIVDGIQDPFAALDDAWRLVYANEAIESLTRAGVTRDAVIGKPFWDHFPGIAASGLRSGLERAMRDRHDAAHEYHDLATDRSFELRVSPFAGGISLIFRDTTDRLRDEAAVRASEARFRDLFAHAPIAYFSLDGAGTVHMANKRALALLGVESDAVIGRPFFSFIDDPAFSGERGGAASFERDECAMKRGDGSRVWVRITTRPVEGGAGGVKRTLAVAEDITLAKLTEAETRRRTREQGALNEILLATQEHRDFVPMVEAVARATAKALRTTRCLVILKNREDGNLVVAGGHDQEYPTEIFRGVVIEKEKVGEIHGIIKNVMDTCAPHAVADVPSRIADEGLRAKVVSMGILSSLYVPIVARGRSIGVLSVVDSRAVREFDARDIELARKIAGHASVAIETAHLYEDLRDREAMARSLVEEVLDYAIYLLAPDGTVSTWNRGGTRIEGYAADDIVGKNFAVFYEPAEVAQGAPARSLREAEEHGRFEEEGWRVRKDGSRFWANVVLTSIRDASGTLLGYSKITRDLTTQKRAERVLAREKDTIRLLKDVATASNEAHSHEVAIREGLAAICAYTDWPLGHAYVLDESARTHSEDDRTLIPSKAWWHAAEADFETFIADSLATSITPGAGLIGRAHATSAPAWMPDVSTDPGFLRSESAKAVGLASGFAFPIVVAGRVVAVLEFYSKDVMVPDEATLGLVQNVGSQLGRVFERERERSTLKRHARELARSNRELEQFAYVASHDLQEPLRMVTSYVQLLERRYSEALDADAHDFIAYAVDGAKRMQCLIEDLLIYSRVGTRGETFGPLAVGTVVDNALKNLEVAIGESHATITRAPLPEIVGDAGQITQVFQNLIGNALKFRSDAPPEIGIDAERVGDAWEFSVTDNGIGIAETYRERVFVIFQRLHTREEYDGTGIGLAVCRKIIERHGGRIWVEASPSGGASFKFTVPISREAAP